MKESTPDIAHRLGYSFARHLGGFGSRALVGQYTKREYLDDVHFIIADGSARINYERSRRYK